MNYSVLEQQTMKDGSFAVVQPIPVFNDYHQAMSRYHSALESAHLSTACSMISVSMIADDGHVYASEVAAFHEPEPEEE